MATWEWQRRHYIKFTASNFWLRYKVRHSTALPCNFAKLLKIEAFVMPTRPHQDRPDGVVHVCVGDRGRRKLRYYLDLEGIYLGTTWMMCMSAASRKACQQQLVVTSRKACQQQRAVKRIYEDTTWMMCVEEAGKTRRLSSLPFIEEQLVKCVF